MNLGYDIGTKIDSSVPFSELKKVNRGNGIGQFRANLAAQIYQASLGGVCPLLGCSLLLLLGSRHLLRLPRFHAPLLSSSPSSPQN
jgi:hypothetical protein